MVQSTVHETTKSSIPTGKNISYERHALKVSTYHAGVGKEGVLPTSMRK